MGSSSVVGKAFLMAFVLISFTVLSFAALETFQQSCSDGTKYGACSTASVGKKCTVPSPPIQYAPPVLIDAASLCPCPAGYTTNADVCEKQTCSDGTGYNECSKTIGKTWYRCEGGQLVERASACACPAGYLKNADKCTLNGGCVKNSDGTNGPITCPPDKYCDSDNANATYNTCVLKAGCQYGNPACTISQTCEADGSCTLKNGCTYNNPGCNLDKEVCRNNACVAKSAFDGLSAGSITNATTSGASPNSLSCCCLPAAGAIVTLAGAFAIGRKKEE